MANYNNLKATINANIKANGNEEITGPILNTVLNQAVTTLGDGWSYKGIATPSMSPGTPDSNVFYIATTAGTYTNFGSLVVAEGEVAILKYNGSWAKEVTGAATAAQVTQLGQEVNGDITKEISWSNGYVQAAAGLVKSSTLSRFSQPFLLKAGEKVTVGTQNSNIGIICSTNADSVAVGDTVTVIKATSSSGQFETYEYTATEDIKIVVCVLASNYNLSFYDTDNLTEKIGNAATKQELNSLGQEVADLDGQINGYPAVVFSKSDYELQAGLITGGVFRSNSVYGTKNKHVLIPMTENRGRTIRLTMVSGHYSNTIIFLTTDTLVSGEPAPYCSGTSDMYTDGDYTVPEDCVCLYVYAEREGADSFPSLKMLAIDGTVCSSDRAEDIEASVVSANQRIDEVGEQILILAVNNIIGTIANYTLSEAVAAIPQSMRRPYCILIYPKKIYSYYYYKIAFYKSAGIRGWLNLDNWTEVEISDWSNVSESAGAFKMNYSGQTAVGANTSIRRVLVPFEKMVVYRHSSDNYGRWRILVRYADNTNEFVNISANEITTITPSKETLGFELILMSTSETCNIDADVLVGAAEKVFELTYKTDPTAESLGAVPINQGIGNAGRPLVVGADGNVAPGTATPSTVDGDAVRKVLSRELHLGADLASVTSMGTGWSGSVANGFTHTSGNTDPLVLNSTTNGNAYLVTINCDTNAENLYLVSIGNGPLLDPYNGTTQQRVGIISDGGEVKITPSSSFAGTMTIKVQECVSEADAVETVTLNINNVEAENMGAAITAFWNVAIGPGQSTLGKAVSASRNIAIGINSLPNLETGTRNIGIGTFAMSQLKNGLGNIAIGADANFLRQSGNDNIAIGRASFGGSKSESTNNGIFIGVIAGSQAIGDDNIAIGKSAGYKAVGGCVYVGSNAGFSFTGANNVAIGRNAGYQTGTISGNWNTLVGPTTSFANGVSKAVAIGYNSHAAKTGQNVIGSSESVETKVYGDLVVHGTDGIDRRIVFNNDNSVTWEAVNR